MAAAKRRKKNGAKQERPTTGTIVCSHCKVEKPVSGFGTDSGTTTGFCSQCSACRRWIWKKHKYGMDEVGYRVMYKAQGGLCRCCSDPVPLEEMDTDHCHASGRVRSLLCKLCNRGIGHFYESPERLRAAASYCERIVVKSSLPGTSPSANGWNGA